MKGSFKLHEKQEQKKKEEEFSIPCKPCVICQKQLKAPYGRFIDGDKELWVCSASCEKNRLSNI